MSFRVILRLAVFGIIGLGMADAVTAADRAPGAVLHLTNGAFVPGELRGSDDPNVLRWQCPSFARPFEFPLGAVSAVHYAVAGPPPEPSGEYCFDLAGGDAVYGDLLGLSEDGVEIDSGRVGRVHLHRAQVRRFYRRKGADSIYVGPNGLAGWKDSSATPQWRDEGGQLSTDRPGASLFGDVGLPEKAVIDVELSWKQRADFVLALGVDERVPAVSYAFQFEVWDGELVAVGESARDADMVAVQQLRAGEGHVRVQAYLDQAQRSLVLLSGGDKPLTTLQVSANKARVRTGVRLTNIKGDVRLEQLRVRRWNGLPPREVRADQSRLHRTDGSIVYGQLTAFDPVTKQFTLRDGTKETVVGQDAVADVFLAPRPSADKAATGPAPDATGTLRLAYRDGARFSGTLTRLEDAHLTLACPGAREPLRLPLDGLRSLIVLRKDNKLPGAAVAGRPGRLEMDGLSLPGRLVEGTEGPDASCLVWHPDLGLHASPLLPGQSGRIVYREPPPPRPTVTATAQGVMRVMVAKGQVIQRVERTPAHVQPPASGRRCLHLRSGDAIPCEVTRITEQGVEFKTPLSDATFVAHDKIKSVELVATQEAPQLDEAKRDRLLTLPRLQKGSPPTHLICSRNGDFLRGRVLEMDAARLKVEVRLETREVPRDRVAQIIWLHPDELADGKPTPPSGDAPRTSRVQAVHGDGNRLTFVAQKADRKTISGTSEVLGACRVELAEIDQLLFGTFIEQSAAKLAYHAWRLHHATEPKFVQSEAGASADGGLTGIESPLVGQPAFPIKLDMLDGSRFELAEHKGRVVVLDFWATWCGPCMQTMPLIDEVVREFADRKVELVAVNLEEQPEQIKSMLERHKLKVPVVLDRDGIAAAKYAVTAIPQTVVIDRDGKVVRLFVGGGKKTADSLRKALQELVAEKPAPATMP